MNTVVIVILVAVVVAVGLVVAWRRFVPPFPPRPRDAFTDPEDPHTPDRSVLQRNRDAELRYEERRRRWEARLDKRAARKWSRASITWTQLDETSHRAEVRYRGRPPSPDPGGSGIYLLAWNPDDAFDDERWELRAEGQSFARLAWWETKPTLAEAEAIIRRNLAANFD